MASNHPSKARAVADAARGESPDRRNSDHRKPDYRKIAHELAQLGQEAASRAHATGNGRYARLAHTLTSRAGEILNDLDRGGKA